MRTVKEVSELTGISVRTLHYYDEIGLLRPTVYSGAGYRLYDDKALETLQQILFFREFDMPLKEIKAVMENPDFDEERILKSQRKMLELKRERLDRLISGIDDILKGVNRMNFEVFDETEIEEMYQSMVGKMDEQQVQVLTERYGGLENFRKHFLESAGSQQAQENFQKVVEWYGDKESVKESVKNPGSSEIMQAYQNRIDAIYRRLADKKGTDVSAFEVKALIGEYDFVSKQLYQMKDVSKLMKELAESCRTDERMKEALDQQYGEGASEYIGEAILEFYKS
ncbi:MerR family transcriptional regulator [Qiania dongpingensis]|uniref:MerR family transcriptional regulator n=1 Tax=Qiania dongpingensis TaxID=2763669 RepID=A0A7G9G2Y0_9FIRM|nr:MerR family transcriptional regulator [Qiania dongpingensis]QNM05162.1 MerR family transcriptional regulator [Qiania dongpingensis]